MRADIIAAVVARSLVALLWLSGCDKLFGLVPVSEVDAVVTECPASYGITLGGFPSSKYRYERTAKQWRDAETVCEQDAPGISHLVVVQDENERMAVAGALASANASGAWIGLSDRIVEADFRWVTFENVGTPPLATPPWASGQPNNLNEADCVGMLGPGAGADAWHFADEECIETIGYVCECDFIPPAPMSF